ncbi:MAG: VOC family protein [Chloroflexi bacterium]|nr:VOC family protein [Chloroflexota bacterium]
MARFIERRGEGVHHIAFEVENLQAKLDDLAARGVELIDKSPREGLSGDIAFLHPRATRGVLIELVDQDTARR